jgi:hypothetical protein
MKDYTQRANVKKFLPWWKNEILKIGGFRSFDHAIEWLEAGKYKMMNRKDALGIIQSLKKEKTLHEIKRIQGI